MIERIDLLARRVRWLDRHRRSVAISTGLSASPIIYSQLSPDWPRVHAVALFITCGFVMWWLTEVALAGLAALWETEHNEIARDRGLPRAIVRK